MSRITILFLTVVLALAGVVALGARPITVAQADTAVHPVVGAWWSANDAPGPGVNSAYSIFHADGTYLEVDPNLGVGVGPWRATGERTADLTYVFQDIDPDPAATAPGTVTVRQSVAVDSSGNAFTSPLTVEVRIPDGTVVFTASYMARGTRLEVEPMLPVGTPTAGTPAP